MLKAQVRIWLQAPIQLPQQVPVRTPAEHLLTCYTPPGRALVSSHRWKVMAPRLESARYCTGEASASEEQRAGRKSLERDRDREEETGQREGGNSETFQCLLSKLFIQHSSGCSLVLGWEQLFPLTQPLLDLIVRKALWEMCFRSPSRSW